MSDKAQDVLLHVPQDWESKWAGMPEYAQKDLKSFDSIKVHFRNLEDKQKFLALLGEHPARKRSIWYPKMEMLHQSQVDAPAVTVEPNKYPVYIISKGRYESRLTAKALEKLGIKFRIVVEPQEYDAYAAVMSKDKILVLPFSNLGQGSIPARNWVWEHSISIGAERHWILDDNMDGFYRMNDNKKIKVVDFNPFIAVEEFTDRYENVVISGMNYEFFAVRRSTQPPFYLNTRVYSCILIQNNLEHRWRGRYNEDTDLSLRVLKDGFCTVLFNAITVKKMPTMTVAGGNTDELYAEDGRKKMAESLKEQHPDVVTITQKWGRVQHCVNYTPFKRNKLILKTEAKPVGELTERWKNYGR